jgi:hypothetical protein
MLSGVLAVRYLIHLLHVLSTAGRPVMPGNLILTAAITLHLLLL